MRLSERYYPCSKKLAERLGISFITLKRWIYQGKIRAIRTIGRRHRIPESEILRLTGEAQRPRKNRAILYARVSGYDQAKDGDLNRQLEHLQDYAMKHGYEVIESVKEIGSGLNDRRPKLLRILRMVAERQVDVMLVEYKDRLTRFGFNYLSEYANSYGARIEAVFDDVKKDAMQELMEDMISIVQSFSAKLYGRRTHKYRQVVGGLRHAVHV